MKYQLGLNPFIKWLPIIWLSLFYSNHIIFHPHWKILFQWKRCAINKEKMNTRPPSSPCGYPKFKTSFWSQVLQTIPDFPFSESVNPLFLLFRRLFASVSFPLSGLLKFPLPSWRLSSSVHHPFTIPGPKTSYCELHLHYLTLPWPVTSALGIIPLTWPLKIWWLLNHFCIFLNITQRFLHKANI